MRGEFDVIGKVFTLQEGAVTFTGGTDIDPEIDLTAVYESSDLTAIVHIQGTASNPQLSLSSIPELPQDEILSRVLFDKPAGQLSALEAAQLAESLATLTGVGGGGPGILDFARRTLGVDVLRVGSGGADGTEPTLDVGKYLTDDVYLGVEQGTKPGSTAATVEIELTPNITLETEVGLDASSEVGITWEWDY